MYYVAGHCCDCLSLISSIEGVRCPPLLLSGGSDLVSLPMPSWNRPTSVNRGIGHVKSDFVVLFFFHLFSVVFKSIVGFDFKTRS